MSGSRYHVEWTPEEDAYIRQRKAVEATCDAIAREMRPKFGIVRSRNAIAGRWGRLCKLDREGLEARPPRKRTGVIAGPPVAQETRTSAVIQARQGRRPMAEYIKSDLPFLVTKNGELLHVYPRDPYARMPLATYERRGDWWVRRTSTEPRPRFRTMKEAVGAHASEQA